MILLFQATLLQRLGDNQQDYYVQWWDEVAIDVMTSSVRIDVISVYTMNLNGFLEVEFYVGTSKRILMSQILSLLM